LDLIWSENNIRECNRVRVTSVIKNTPSGQFIKDSEVLRAGRGTEEDSTSFNRNKGRERV